MSALIYGFEVEAESGVSAQPMGFEETRLGALNRLKAARASAAQYENDLFFSFCAQECHGFTLAAKDIADSEIS